MAFVTAAEFEVWLGRGDDPFTAAEQTRAEQLLADATGVIEGEAGQTLTSQQETVILDGVGTDTIILPRWPVTAVAAVTVVEDRDIGPETLTFGDDYEWTQAGLLRRVDAVWPCLERSVTVTYTAGYTVIADDLKRICKRLAATAWDNPIGADAEDIGDRRVRWHVPGMELTSAEKRLIGRYRART